MEPTNDDEITTRMGALISRLGKQKPPAARAPSADPRALDGLPVAERLQSLAALTALAPTDGASLMSLGALAASLARTAPENLTPALLDQVSRSAPAARGFMQGVSGIAPAARAALLSGVPVDSRKRLFDELGTDGGDLPHSAALVASLASEDPELAAEAIHWGGKTLARAVTGQLSDLGLAGLPKPVQQALGLQLQPAPEQEL